jgi:phage gpG-like protein
VTDALRFTLDAEGLLQARLNGAVAQLGHSRELMQAIGARLQTNIKLRFRTKTDPEGLAWLPLADSTRAQYRREDTGKNGQHRRRGSLLQRSGHMLASLTVNAIPEAVEVGFSVPYAIWHELGTQRMPRRPMLMAEPISGRLGDTDRQDVLDELEAFLAQALGGSPK